MCKDPRYGKLHVGIYVAGIQDAIDCEKQKQQHLTLPSVPCDDSDNNSTGGDGSEDNQNGDPGGHNKCSCRGGQRDKSHRGGCGGGERSGFQSKADNKGVNEAVAVKVCILTNTNMNTQFR